MKLSVQVRSSPFVYRLAHWIEIQKPADRRHTCYNGQDKEPRPRAVGKLTRSADYGQKIDTDTAGAACCLSVCHAHNKYGIHWNRAHTAQMREFRYQDQRAYTTSQSNFSFYSRRARVQKCVRLALSLVCQPRNCHECREQTLKIKSDGIEVRFTRELILFAISIFSVSSSEWILIYNEEILVAVRLVGFVSLS